MKNALTNGILSLAFLSAANAAEGLYSVGVEPEDSIPLAWFAGMDLTYDDNLLASSNNEFDTFSVTPYIGASLQSVSPQTLVEVFAKLGMNYYFDTPPGIDDTSSQSRLNLSIRHNFTERLGVTSTNVLAYEMEPNYDYGIASSRQSEEHFFWSTDNYVSFRWNDLLSTRTGFQLTGLEYQNTDDSNRLTVTGYHQFRYRLQPLTILTAEYRYGVSTGDGQSSDSTEHYLLVGAEHRLSPNTVGMFKVGVQARDVDAGSSSTSPYAILSFRTIMNEQFSFSGYMHYGIEGYDTVQTGVPGLLPGTLVEYDERETLRLGLTGSYLISQQLSVFGGVNYVPTQYTSGRVIPTGAPASDVSEDLINTYVGLSMKFTENLTGTLTYNHTVSNSDITARDYDRNRISLGVNTQF